MCHVNLVKQVILVCVNQGCHTNSTKGRVAAGFWFNQATAHQTELIKSTDLSLQTVDWSNSVLDWLEQKPAVTRPFVESIWHPWCQWYMLQGEGTSSLVSLRARTRDTPSPNEELSSPLTRGKRIATRNRGQGENSGTDAAVTLPSLPKRLCFSSVAGPVRTLFPNYRLIHL